MTRAWQILLQGQEGSPRTVEITFEVNTPAKVEKLQGAFIAAGGAREAPSDQLMNRKNRYCPVVDSFGTSTLLINSIEDSED
jgi:hypothetical protein